MATLDQIVQSIDSHLDELHAEIDALAQARTALLATAGPRSHPAPSRAPRRRSRPIRQRRSPRTATTPVTAERLRTLLVSHDGASTATLAEMAEAEPRAVLPLLREMESTGRIRRSGQRRSTRWHAVANEDEWVAQRAAELAATASTG